jgi:hypothetical protein
VGGTTGQLEVTWNSKYRPLPFEKAPLLINNLGQTRFPAVLSLLQGTQRSTFCGAAGSRFRSRTQPIGGKLSEELIGWFSKPGLPKAKLYIDAIETPDGQWRNRAAQARWAIRQARRLEFAALKYHALAQAYDGARCRH